MSKYSEFERRPLEWYPTPKKAVLPLTNFLNGHHGQDPKMFIEPMAGDGRLINHLQEEGFTCGGAFDINPIQPETEKPYPSHAIRQADVLSDAIDGELHNGKRHFEGFVKTANQAFGGVTIITNPPYINTKNSGYQLFRLINQFRVLAPTWLLLESDFAQNKYSWAGRDGKEGVMNYCSDIIPIGRVKWIEDSTDTGKVNSSWFRFQNTLCFTTLRERE